MTQRGIATAATRALRLVIPVVAASVLAAGTLAACGGASDGGSGISDIGGPGDIGGSPAGAGGSPGDTGGSPGDVGGSGSVTGSGSPGDAGGSGSGGSVTGTVTWPDGHPAANASVFFYNYDPGFTASGWYDGKYEVQQLPADGSYSLPDCPCQDLTAYIHLTAKAGADPANGGQDCWIIMQDDHQNYSGRQANPGDVINWQALDMPCSSTWYTSDQTTVQSEISAVLPSFNSGSWQAAEARTSNG